MKKMMIFAGRMNNNINMNKKWLWSDPNIPPKASYAYILFSDIQHPLAIKLDTNRTKVFPNSFILMTSRDWNSLSSVRVYLLITFSRIHAFNPKPIIEISTLHDARLHHGLQWYIFLENLFVSHALQIIIIIIIH